MPPALRLEPLNVTLLPQGPRVVVVSDVPDGVAGRYAVEHRQASQCGACSAVPSSAGDLHLLSLRPPPQFEQCVAGVVPVDR